MNTVEKSSNKKASLTTYALVMLIILTVLNRFQFGVSLSGVIIPIAAFILFMMIEKKKICLLRNHVYILLFWVFAVLSSLMSEIIMPRRDVFTFLVFILFYIFSMGVKYKEKDIRLLVKSYIFISVIVSLNIIVNFINDFAYVWKRYSLYVFGVYRDPNYVSAFILPGIAIVLYILFFSDKLERKKKIMYVSSLLIMLLGILSTGSRAAFSVLAIIIALVLLFYIKKTRNHRMIIRVIPIMIILAILWHFSKGILPEFLISRLLDFGSYSQSSRLNLWSTGINLITTYPILGVGLGGLNSYLFSVGLFDSHNMYLDVLINQGIIGLLLLGLVFKRYLFVRKEDRSLMLTLMISFFAPLFFINGFNTASFWTPMIICGILSNYSRQNKYGLSKLFQESIKN